MSNIDTELRAAKKLIEKLLTSRKRHRKAVGREWEAYIQDETARNGGKRPAWAKRRKG